jgi:hypothetical protein
MYPSTDVKTETDPDCETMCVSRYLHFQTIAKILKPSDPEGFYFVLKT